MTIVEISPRAKLLKDFLAPLLAELDAHAVALIQSFADPDGAPFRADSLSVEECRRRFLAVMQDTLEILASHPDPDRDQLRRMRHDLRTPINGLRGYSELLIEDAIHRPDAQDLLVGLVELADNIAGVIDATLAEESDDAEDLPCAQPIEAAVMLIVDDDHDNLAVLSRRLERDGHIVTCVDNGPAALALLAEQHFDIMLLDFQMPGMDGSEVLARVKGDSRCAGLSVVMISAGSDSVRVARCLRLGAEDYISKPFNPMLLRARIEACLAKKRLRERERTSWKEQLRAALDIAVDGLMLIDDNGLVDSANAQAERVFGGPLAGKFAPHLVERWRDAAPDQALTAWRDALLASAARGWEHQALRLDGEPFMLELTAKQAGADDHVMYAVAVRDITERKETEARNAYLAQYDPLTDLPNRAFFCDVLTAMLSAQRSGALLIFQVQPDLDLDDKLGPEFDDLLVQRAATRLRPLLAPADMLSRLDGPEFALLRLAADIDGDGSELPETVLDAFARPIDLEGWEVEVNVSIGVAPFPDGDAQAQDLMRFAQLAAAKARRDGPGQIQRYDQVLSAGAKRRKGLERDLRAAIDDDQFELHYQPKICLTTDSVVGMEALLRWRRPEEGFVSPGEFIPVAEASGQIVRIGAWALRTACRQVSEWLGDGMPAPKVAVNVSSMQLKRRTILDTVRDALAESALDPSLLELEITESVIMHDFDSVLALLRDVRDLGVTLTLDDFGTGYSSLSWLQRLPVQKLKIDRAFVTHVADDPQARAILETILRLSSSLELRTIAEGVETQAQANYLRDVGCDEIQGFFFSRPLPPQRFAEFVSSWGGET